MLTRADFCSAFKAELASSHPMFLTVCLTMGESHGFVYYDHHANLRDRFDAVVTVRSEEKGKRLIKSIDSSLGKRVSYVVVENIAKNGAFDQVSTSLSSHLPSRC